MKRIFLLAGLLALGAPAHADGISFSVGGHRVHIEASRHCRSTSCASVSISGIYNSHRGRDRFDDDVAPVQPAPSQPQNVAPPPPVSASPTLVAVAPPATYKPAAVATPALKAPTPPVQQVAIPLPPAPPPSPPPVQQVAIPVPPPIAKVSHEIEQEADTPVGDWQTEGRGAMRITRCGAALCGYVLNSSSDDRGEAVLINMKSKDDAQWTGSVYSRDSGDIFYGTMRLKSANKLHVEACAFGRFYCSGNTWSRIDVRSDSVMTSRQVPAAPRS